MPIKKSLLLIKKHFPFESRFATVSGYHIHYVDEGEGETLLLLHGNPTWSFFYRELIKALSKNYRVIALDHIGCGFSEKPSCTFTAVDRINHLKEFVKALQLKDISLIMHDWGGPIGTGYAVDNPENVKRLIYLNTTLTETESLPPIIKLATTQKVG
ncbi:MAG: alpha/beta fold hydrolase [Candidatus Dadabacteria bacterium]|nr:MAG: alpha/beta fold hydrolase [Candidatus Dadabacteria bacterium]